MTANLYKNLVYWVRNYGSAGIPDQRAIETFIDCETDEMIAATRSELTAVTSGKFTEAIMDQCIGASRRLKYGTYIEWAKMMLLWIANYKH